MVFIYIYPGLATKKSYQLELAPSKFTKSNPLKSPIKTTVEVLDDASPDNTPRGINHFPTDYGNKHDELEQFSFRKEKDRVDTRADTFSQNGNLTLLDLEAEKNRLRKLEDCVRTKQFSIHVESRTRTSQLIEEKCVLKIQSLFRGYIGRKRVKIMHQLDEIMFQREYKSDWIEVSDKETGDKWYYNKRTNHSQWNKPLALHVNPNDDTIQVIAKSDSQNLVKSSHNIVKDVTQEVNQELGISKLSTLKNLTAPDGKFKPQLRNVVLDALLETRFDSVATVLADNRWYSKNEEAVQMSSNSKIDSCLEKSQVDCNKLPMVSVLNLSNKRKNKSININKEDKIGDISHKHEDFTINNIEHYGFDGDHSANNLMCFGCWSAGLQNNCALHTTSGKIKPSETMLLCRNWDISVMRRRYRAEEIQEIFVRRETSLRYDSKRRRFFTVIEQKHPIYRVHSKLLESFNNRMNIFLRIKYWLNSFSEEFRKEKMHKSNSQNSRLLKYNRIMYNKAKVDRFSTINKKLIPFAPITGHTWPERTEKEQYLFNVRIDMIDENADIIVVNPIPLPKQLYAAREYPLNGSKIFPLSNSTLISNTHSASHTLCGNKFIDTLNGAAWLERLCCNISLDAIESVASQIKSFTPVKTVNILTKVKRPQPTTTKFLSIGNKPTVGNLALGGLPWEQLVYHIISTYYSPQYGNFMVMDKSSVSPGVSPEMTIIFKSIIMPPTIEYYVERTLEHPLTYRRSPTIALNSNVNPADKHFYGINRPEQTGEQESHGFRTTTWAPKLQTFADIDPQVFVPGQGVASLNIPKANNSSTTHADFSYPFCEPSTKDNSTLDFYHLLLSGVVSSAKAQVFTALTIQEPGQFQKYYRADLPMGHLVVSVYRSWAFTQQDTIQEFTTDDGISYWYHRKTGQTFWERPLYQDEEPSPLLGGTILDTKHFEEPMMLTKGSEGATRRYLQGEFRNQMLMHIETKKDALSRRKSAAATVKNAKERGILPVLPDFESVTNNINNSVEASRDNFPNKLINSSLADPSKTLSTVNFNEVSENVMQMYALPDSLPDSANNNEVTIMPPPSVIKPQSNQNIGVNGDMFSQLASSVGDIINRIGNVDKATPQDILQLGLTMGLALMQAGSAQHLIDSELNKGHSLHNPISSGLDDEALVFPSVSEEFTEDFNLKSASRVSNGNMFESMKGVQEPIGKPYATAIYSSDKLLNHTEEMRQKETLLSNKERHLNTMEIARNLSVEKETTPTPDSLPPKVLTYERFSNAEEELHSENVLPVVAYSEIATQHHGGALPPYLRKPIAGIGTSFVSENEKDSQLKVHNNPHLTRNVLPLPVGFFEAIEAKHVAKQAVDYLPQVPNLPQSRTIGRVKPRSAAADWLMISFDPWSAGKNPLGTEFVPSLMAKADRLLGNTGGRSGEAIEALRQATVAGAFVNVEDEAGLAEQRAEITKAQVLAQDFKKLCSLCRHSKFSEAEQLINQPDWSVPIDYQDDQGNALIHVAAQNGSKRLVKLCLRRGASLNLQNLNGQTALHFAFGYGYTDVGEYLISKGADDSVRNKDSLTCYEGLGARELALL